MPYVIIILSIPVWGVEIRNDAVEALLAPFLYNDIATGITPQEHNGRGIPINEAFIIFVNELPNKFFCINLSFTTPCKIPAIKKPNNKYGEK
tara:strand:+ start:192 stop:467 length:276 start_codon:yes stop_codon:yes gene_type:complete